MDDILKNVSDEELLEMAVTIKLTYSYNSKGNNWNGHHFIAPNGWKIMTKTIPGAFGVPNGENVSVYNGNDLIKEYEYVLNINPYYKVIKEVNNRIKSSITAIPGMYREIDISTAVGEYICAKVLVEGKYEKDKDVNAKEKEESKEIKKAQKNEKEINEEKGEMLAKIPIKRIRIEWKKILEEHAVPNGILFYYENYPILMEFVYDETNSNRIGYIVTVYDNYYYKDEIIEDLDKKKLEVKVILRFDFYPGEDANRESLFRKARIEELEIDRSRSAKEREFQIICEYIDKISNFDYMDYSAKNEEEIITNIQLEPKKYHSYDYKEFSIFAYHDCDFFAKYPSKITFYIYKEKLSKEDILDGTKRLDHPIWDEVTYSLDGSIDDRFSNYFKKRKKELSKSVKITGWDVIYKIETEIIDKLFNL